MAYKFLYLDDEEERVVAPLVDAIQRKSESLEVVIQQPSTFEVDLDSLKSDTLQGIILDWRLDKVANASGSTAQYKAGALAQEIRSRGSEGMMAEIPIILWSTEEKLAKSYNNDSTSHDLFDKIIHKDSIADNAGQIAAEFEALAEGYRRISESKDQGGESVVSLPRESFDRLHPQAQAILSSAEFLSVHDRARFLFRDVILTPSFLVSEPFLAARLGIDPASPGWAPLIESLPKHAHYLGPFSSAWPRWWSHVVEFEWWLSLKQGLPALSSLPAAERVDAIRSLTGITELAPAEPYKAHYSTWFSTVCAVTGSPLDPVDGFIIESRQAYSWQQRRYVVADIALSGEYRDPGYKLEPAERLRLEALKESLYS